MTASRETDPAQGITARLVAWSRKLTYEDLPDEVVHAARRSILDSLGVTLGGSGSEAAAIVLRLADDLAGAPVASIIGHDRRTDVVTAAMVNGVMAHVLDFDDTLLPTRIHASAPLLPGLLAVGEVRDSPFRDVVTCFAIGLELQARLAAAMYPDYADRGWHGTGVVGPIAVAVAVGRLIDLDEERLAHALGLGATQGAGITAVFGSMAKSLNLARAGASGVHCALLAEQGFTSNPAALDPPARWFERYSDVFDEDALLADLGSRWALPVNGFKPYACGLVAHAAIDAAIELRRTTEVPAQDISTMHLRVPPESLVLMGNLKPSTELEAKFSVAYAAAAAYIDGSAGPATFQEERMFTPANRDLLSRVILQGDPDIAQDESVVTLTTTSGQSHRVHVEHALGTQEHPMTDPQLEEKFVTLAEPVLAAAGAAEAARLVWQLDQEPVAHLTQALRPGQEAIG